MGFVLFSPLLSRRGGSDVDATAAACFAMSAEGKTKNLDFPLFPSLFSSLPLLPPFSLLPLFPSLFSSLPLPPPFSLLLASSSSSLLLASSSFSLLLASSSSSLILVSSSSSLFLASSSSFLLASSSSLDDPLEDTPRDDIFLIIMHSYPINRFTDFDSCSDEVPLPFGGDAQSFKPPAPHFEGGDQSKTGACIRACHCLLFSFDSQLVRHVECEATIS